MAKKSGNFRLYRSLLESDIWLKETFTRGQAWVDLIFLANYKDSCLRIRGQRVQVSRGQLGYSKLNLAKRWCWSRGKLNRFLDELETDQQITQQNMNTTTIITIINYEKYQGNDTADGLPPSTPDGTADALADRLHKRKSNKRKESKERKESGEKDSPTPSEIALSFFSNENRQLELSEKLSVSKGIELEICKNEVKKFVSYWTEKSRSGKKVRWEDQKFFDIGKRMGTWMKNSKIESSSDLIFD